MTDFKNEPSTKCCFGPWSQCTPLIRLEFNNNNKKNILANICSFAAIEWLLYSLVCCAKYGVQHNAQLITSGSGHKMHNLESGPQVFGQ